MTTEEAHAKYGCINPDDSRQYLNVLIHTCAYTCKHCNKSIWFPSFIGYAGNPVYADCPYCGKETTNPYPERKAL